MPAPKGPQSLQPGSTRFRTEHKLTVGWVHTVAGSGRVVTMSGVSSFLGHGIYTVAEAARLSGVSARRARAWFGGWTQDTPGVLGATDYAAIHRPDLVSFLDLVDVVVVGELRNAGISMSTVRRAHQALARVLDSPHPFGRQELFADVKGRLFISAAHEAADVRLTELVSGQGAFPQVLLQYLRKIKYDSKSRLAHRIGLAPNVAIDANLKYGKPIVLSANMPTRLLAGAYIAQNRDEEAVADWYNVTPAEVMDAFRFEQEFDGIAA